jgi:RNA polymerase sigma-70 factor, ECF subfamily
MGPSDFSESHVVRGTQDGAAATVESDEALMERVRAGDRASLGVLADRYWARLVSYAADITQDRDAAQDVVQETFMRLWNRRCEWSASGVFRAFLYRIARNLSLNARRDTQLRQERHMESAMLELDVASPRTPEQATEANSLRDEVEAAISRLSKRRREVFILSRFHGLSHREIAESLGTTPQTVSNQITSALDELRRTLSHLLDEV